ncbi:hypothetical protein JO972_07740 [Verrucomicrobiaceae bacterium 5K15]|uniref:Uncharacterized protein n=1 Tax=Oceaniferula flava TaxID=2800421 RepID=A0AAE2V834_9BACT|nr:hypothetical protein [Oceaniferula flavus]MBK1854847.1 hypothetical protein [Oceaniferula flavus]MBM1136153.1 hypothetical protein [Oceaniferula flavus]
MDRLQSWLDAKEVRRMAESLMAPAPEVEPAAVDAGYGDDFEGFANAKGEVSNGNQPDLPGMKAAVEIPVRPRFSQVSQSAHVPQGLDPEVFPPVEAPMPTPSAPLVEPEQADESLGTTARIVVSHALADAKRLAEGSGMLASETQAAAEITVNQPPVPTSALAPQVASPFQMCEDQSMDEEVPMARQVNEGEDSWAPEVQQEVQPDAEIDPAVAAEKQIAPADPQPESQPESNEKVTLPSGSPPPAARPSTGVARGPFLTRLKKFSGQLRERLGTKAMFLIDNEGQILIDEVGNSKLIQVARTLANASRTASRQTEGAADVGNLHVKIGASATLEVIPCRSLYGLLILGVICPAPLGAERVRQVAEHLAKTVDPSGGV